MRVYTTVRYLVVQFNVNQKPFAAFRNVPEPVIWNASQILSLTAASLRYPNDLTGMMLVNSIQRIHGTYCWIK